tara:strand:+ start:1879 stop:2229 length:351 start_codon:yes stop_codon:yes gene_type:complete
MKKFRLTLITENQNSIDKGKRFADLICETLDYEKKYEISKYEKFENSYRIEIVGDFKNRNDLILESIELTDRIASPWIVRFDKNENKIELMFDKTDNSVYRNIKFNVLIWANFEIE